MENIDYEEMAKSLAGLCELLDKYEYGYMPIDGKYKETKAQVVAIGKTVNQAGEEAMDDGLLLMRAVCLGASGYYRNTGNTLNYAWNGIGRWES